jgi:hypothetical protein
MSKRWIVILLFISLAFNLAVMIMFLHITAFRKPLFNPSLRSKYTSSSYERRDSEKSRKRPEDMLANKEEIQMLKENFRVKRRDFLNAMRQENFNEQAAIIAMQASLQAQELLEEKLGNSLIEFRKKITPEEAREYFRDRRDRTSPKTRYDGPDTNKPKNNQ